MLKEETQQPPKDAPERGELLGFVLTEDLTVSSPGALTPATAKVQAACSGHRQLTVL